jgi:hypothetical protein
VNKCPACRDGVCSRHPTPTYTREDLIRVVLGQQWVLMTTLASWCHCGSPLWRDDHDEINPTVDSVDGCRLCGLDHWTTLDVWDEASGIIRDGYRTAPRAVDVYDDYAYHWPESAGADNSTDDTDATSHWLPRRSAARWLAPEGLTSTEADRLELWLASAKVAALTSPTPP